MNNDQAILDTRKAITGKDGQVFITTSSGNTIFLAELENFQAQLNVSNTDFQPVGSALSFAIPTGYTVSITFSEMVVRDDVMLTEIFEDLKRGYLPSWDFQGKLGRRDGQESRQVYRNCILDGSLDLMNITPGEIIKRALSLRCNAIPEMLSAFTTV